MEDCSLVACDSTEVYIFLDQGLGDISVTLIHRKVQCIPLIRIFCIDVGHLQLLLDRINQL